LIDTLKEPAVFVVCDLENRKVYWHDIQTNEKTLGEYNRVLREDKSQIKIILDESYILPESSEELNRYVRHASSHISKREEIRRIANESLTTAIEEIRQYEESISLKGYDIHFGTDLPDDARRKVVFRTTDQKSGKQITYVTNDDFTQEDLPKIRTQFIFPKTDDGAQKFNEIQEVLERKRDFVEISGDYIKHIEISTTTKIINDTNENPYSMLRLSVFTVEKEIFIRSVLSGKEIRVKADMWQSADGSLIMDNSRFEEQPLSIKFELDFENNAFYLHYELKSRKLNNVGNIVFYRSFIEEIKGGGEVCSYENGIRSILFRFSGDVAPGVLEEEPNFQFLLQLAFIQEKIGIAIPYPLPPNMSLSDMYSVSTIYELLRSGRAVFFGGVTTSFELVREMKVGDTFVSITPMDYTLLGVPISLPGKRVKIQGIVSALQKKDDLCEIKVENGEITFDED
jgi:hypothetical protein